MRATDNFKDYKGITEGVENTNYFIRTSEQDYILTIYEKRVAENDLPFFIKLLSILSEKRFPCPKPIANKNNENMKTAIQNNRIKKGAECYKSKLSEQDVIWIRKNYIPRHLEFGGKFAKTPKEASKDSDFVFCCVGNDNDLKEVTSAPALCKPSLDEPGPAAISRIFIPGFGSIIFSTLLRHLLVVNLFLIHQYNECTYHL